MKAARVAGLVAAVLVALGSPGQARAGAPGTVERAEAADVDPFEKKEATEPAVPPLPDPLEGMNRAFFAFNDKLYFWFLRPVAGAYKSVVPRPARVGVRNVFSNLGAPARSLNCLLQGDLKGSGTELARFGVNTTVGVLGFGDPGKHWLKLTIRKEDFGQTLGVWGIGMGSYSNFPILGPSCTRDTVGFVVDVLLDPLTFMPGVGLVSRVNSTSLSLGEYEDFKKSVLDPYVAMRDAYNQHRRHAVASWD
ncbi:MAG TPA: VacJ family lipoprotein [Planctomycetota bacterium]|nr:VacJ family lipoprotein [Planctomycetota bacterium]